MRSSGSDLPHIDVERHRADACHLAACFELLTEIRERPGADTGLANAFAEDGSDGLAVVRHRCLGTALPPSRASTSVGTIADFPIGIRDTRSTKAAGPGSVSVTYRLTSGG